MIMTAKNLTSFRAKVAYSPAVLGLMEHSAAGCLIIDGEDAARSWADTLPLWGPPHYGLAPDTNRSD
ncbi:MAG: hypothetical protein JKY37_01150 [Nannocystaceae bacterium]|nr:hypothetical protein [Nannocystaceae bacterium]